MATPQTLVRRLIAAGGLAVALVAAPTLGAIAVSAPQPQPAAQVECPAGEEADQFTGLCAPFAVPNSAPSVSIPSNPDVPFLQGPGSGGLIPCANPNRCIGLSQSQATGPHSGGPPPQSTVGGSPTVTGQLGR